MMGKYLDYIMVAVCLLTMIIYNSYVIFRYKKVPVSLSETAYMIGGEKSLKRYWFTLYCIITVFTILQPLFNNTISNLQFIPFLLCSGLLFAGFSPAFKNNLPEKQVHYVSAGISFSCFILYGFFCMPWYWLLGYILLLGILCIWKRTCYVYFAEILALSSICIWLLI